MYYAYEISGCLVAMMHWVLPCRPLAAEDQVRSEERNEDEMSKKITKERNKQGEISERGKMWKGGEFWK
jgi:uncharacterized membrane protein